MTGARTVRNAPDEQLTALLTDIGQRVAAGGQIGTDDVAAAEALWPPGKESLGRLNVARCLLAGTRCGALGALRATADSAALDPGGTGVLLTELDSDLADLVEALGRRFALGTNCDDHDAAAAARLLPAGKRVFDRREGAFAMCAGAQLGAAGALRAIKDVQEGRAQPPGHHPGWAPGR